MKIRGPVSAIIDIKAIPGSSVVFACETVAQCEDTYRELAKMVDDKDLAVWTNAHDADRDPSDIEFKFGFVPERRFERNVLDRRRVVVVTHSLLRQPTGENGRTYKGAPRTLRILDERMNEVDLLDIDLGDVMKARDWAVREFGNLTPPHGAIALLFDYLEGAWQSGREGARQSFVGLEHDSLLWFNSPAAEDALRALSKDSPQAKVIRFAQSLASGYAFMSCFDGTMKGGSFIGYKMDLPVLPGTILLDATSDIDGIAALAPWMTKMQSPRASYENLEITHMSIPKDILKGMTLSDVTKAAKTAQPYAAWIKRTVVENTKPGEHVLVVAQKALIDHGYLPTDATSLDEGKAYDLEGRKVAFIWWGKGIGSNRWKTATAVFHFGEHFIPKRAHNGTVLALRDEPAGSSPYLADVQSPNTQNSVYLTVRDGHVLRWTKQLAMRGNARNLSDEGVCGYQRLYVTTDMRRFVNFRTLLFPGAKINVAEESKVAHRDRGGAASVAAFIMGFGGDRFTSKDLLEATGMVRNNLSLALSHPTVTKALADGGWELIKGKGRAPSMFVKRPALAVAA